MYNYYKEIPKITPNNKYNKEINIELLQSLFEFQTPTGNFKKQHTFLKWLTKEFINKNKIKCSTKYDNYGNMYITKGKADVYPCVVSHIDTVHPFKKDFKTYKCDDFIIGLSNGEQCGIGADPKAGLYILLDLLLVTDNIKCVLFLNEEIGCCGSSVADIKWFNDCAYVLQFDRRSFTTDVIEYTNSTQVLSEEFKYEITANMKQFGYFFNNGTLTDVGQLTNNEIGICTSNISNGSFNEHCDNEVCELNHLLNALNFGIDLIKTIPLKRWEFIPEIPKSKKWKNYQDEELIEEYDIFKGEQVMADSLTLDCIEEGYCELCTHQDTLIKIEENSYQCIHCATTYIIPEDLQKRKVHYY